MNGKYSIQLASKISGVGVHTIRAWEKRYQAVTPNRSDNGRREYNDKDVERLSLLNELCTLGHSISKIAAMETTNLRKLLKKLGKKADSVEKVTAIKGINGSVVNIEQSLKSLILALKTYKLDIISHEINKLKILLSSRQFALDIIGPLMAEVGTLVYEKEFNISQEHALSAILKFHIGHTLFKNTSSRNNKPHKILICSPEGDYHEFGILQAALLCNHYGLQFYYLGPNLPVDSLIDAYKSLDASMVILGSTVIPDGKDTFYLNNYFKKLMSSLGPNGHLFVGGGNHIQDDVLNKGKKGTHVNSIKQLDRILSEL